MQEKPSKATLASNAKLDRLITELEGITDDKYTSNKDRLRIVQLQTDIENMMRGGMDTTLDKKKGGAVKKASGGAIMKARGGTFKGTF
jgi:hypothetical protein